MRESQAGNGRWGPQAQVTERRRGTGALPPAGMPPLPQRAMGATGRRPAIVPQAFVPRRYDVGGQLTPFAARAYHTGPHRCVSSLLPSPADRHRLNEGRVAGSGRALAIGAVCDQMAGDSAPAVGACATWPRDTNDRGMTPSCNEVFCREQATCSRTSSFRPMVRSSRARPSRRASSWRKSLGAKVTGYYAYNRLLQPSAFGDGDLIDKKMVTKLDRLARTTGEKYLDQIARQSPRTAGVDVRGADHQAGDHVRRNHRRREEEASATPSSWRRAGAARSRSLLLGSVTQKVLSHSRVPVIVFR
jgi:nucleotide-binding universal stress UspA family protein